MHVPLPLHPKTKVCQEDPKDKLLASTKRCCHGKNIVARAVSASYDPVGGNAWALKRTGFHLPVILSWHRSVAPEAIFSPNGEKWQHQASMPALCLQRPAAQFPPLPEHISSQTALPGFRSNSFPLAARRLTKEPSWPSMGPTARTRTSGLLAWLIWHTSCRRPMAPLRWLAGLATTLRQPARACRPPSAGSKTWSGMSCRSTSPSVLAIMGVPPFSWLDFTYFAHEPSTCKT